MCSRSICMLMAMYGGFRKRRLPDARRFRLKALDWKGLHDTASHLISAETVSAPERQHLCELAKWFDAEDVHSLSVGRYLTSRSPRTPNRHIDAVGFLCLREGLMLSDSVVDSALVTISNRFNNLSSPSDTRTFGKSPRSRYDPRVGIASGGPGSSSAGSGSNGSKKQWQWQHLLRSPLEVHYLPPSLCCQRQWC